MPADHNHMAWFEPFGITPEVYLPVLAAALENGADDADLYFEHRTCSKYSRCLHCCCCGYCLCSGLCTVSHILVYIPVRVRARALFVSRNERIGTRMRLA